jgi:hypothetical protein
MPDVAPSSMQPTRPVSAHWRRSRAVRAGRNSHHVTVRLAYRAVGIRCIFRRCGAAVPAGVAVATTGWSEATSRMTV